MRERLFFADYLSLILLQSFGSYMREHKDLRIAG